MDHKTSCTRCLSSGIEAHGTARYSLGIYAGRYCDDCWVSSGYRDEGPEGFDPMDAGETYEAEEGYLSDFEDDGGW